MFFEMKCFRPMNYFQIIVLIFIYLKYFLNGYLMKIHYKIKNSTTSDWTVHYKVFKTSSIYVILRCIKPYTSN